LLNSCVEVLTVVPPLRNFTVRLYCRIVSCLRQDYELSPEQRVLIGQALKGIAEILKDHIKTGNLQTTLRVYDEIIKETNKTPITPSQP
jgi:hypothetical protein